MHTPEGISPNSPIFKILEKSTQASASTMNAKIHTLQQRIHELCDEEFKKNGMITKESTSKLKQIHVQIQTHDGTGASAENCGYHSLKNALCLMTALLLEENFNYASIVQSFTNPQIFKDFYQSYALPLLTEKPQGQKDASDPLIRQMISLFVSDLHPIPSLIPFQKVLKNNLDKLGIYTLLPAENEVGLKFAVMDEAGFRDALKIFRFSQKKGPAVLIGPVGDVNTMHWYSIAMIKNQNGTINFFGCDSLGSNQRGKASPLGKACRVFEQALANPKEFIESALSSFVEGFERYGNWLDSKGRPDTEASKTSLMNLAKDPPNLPAICNLALENMIEQNWQNSSDIQKVSQFQKIVKLVNFYARS